MIVVVLFALLILKTTNGVPTVYFDKNETEIHMDDQQVISYTIEGLISDVKNLTAISSNLDVVKIFLPNFDPNLINNGSYKGFINITGVFLGSASISLSLETNRVSINYHFF